MKNCITKYTCSILLTTFISLPALAGNFQPMDDILLEVGVVDENYKYVDDAFAEYIFTFISLEASKNLPDNSDPQMEITSLNFTPYVGEYVLTYKQSFSEFEREMIKSEFKKISYTTELCEELFDAKFQHVNNFTLIAKYLDSNKETIGEIVLNNEACGIS